MENNCDIELMDKAVNYMSERCHHFYILVTDRTDFKFIIISSIDKEYNDIIRNESYDNINYKYFIGLKYNSDRLTSGVYDVINHSIIYEESLHSYHPESKHGEKITADEADERMKKAMSSYSNYRQGSWSDLQKIYVKINKISHNVLSENNITEDSTIWDDGTYELKYVQDILLDKHKKIIKNKIIDKEHKPFLDTIYANSYIVCRYRWSYDNLQYLIAINSLKDPYVQCSYVIDEYDVKPQFDYVEPAAKSSYLFDFTNIN